MFLTPRGEVLSGGTYVGPERLAILLQQVADTFATRHLVLDEEAQQAARRRDARVGESAGTSCVDARRHGRRLAVRAYLGGV